MTLTQRTLTMQAVLVAALFAVFPPGDAGAQGGDGFLFKVPKVSVGFRMGYAGPRAGSEIFTHTKEFLTSVRAFPDDPDSPIQTSDFAAAYYGGELAVRLSSRFDIGLGVGHAKSITPSEFRCCVDNDNLSIEQVTEFSTTPLTLSGKYYLTDRGRSIGRFAWVPSTLNAFVGGGVGLTFYRFAQSGDWVNLEKEDGTWWDHSDLPEDVTLGIFSDQWVSTGSGKQVHLLAGLDVSIDKNLYLTGEGRYLWADAPINRGFFEGFDDVDLSGFQFTIGISARF
jgi:hypothetical protein